jgi:hypothetical protein
VQPSSRLRRFDGNKKCREGAALIVGWREQVRAIAVESIIGSATD